ncbi:RES family NAD+ phosphorylase [Rhizobium leguminosarum]|uniref:RES domain-containing protein n=1 Tax=Rhizobium leguminosarum TaxID=384 RepID=UPI001C9668E3|nr:RES domain-containing protein [Rhizobium leguminosarum]MBY5707427.1 RES family NAD+ phosphorylase [Rhizobium leguminosarum]
MSLSRLEIRQEIKKLNRLDPKRAEYSAINSTYSKITDGLHVVVGKAGGGELFYRVRRTRNLKPSMITELQAPPSHFVTGYQRCNPPGIPMFYAASQRLGALIEARVEAGEIVYLSQWIGHDQIPVNKVFDSEENQRVPGVNVATISGPNDDILLTYLDTQFTKRIHSTFADDYKFTAAIAQQLTTGFPPNDFHDVHEDGHVALKYPSVLGVETFHNTAMHATFAAKRLELLHVMELRIKSIEGNDILVESLDTAVNFEGNVIKWTSNPNILPEPLEGDRSVPFIFDGKKWNIKTYDGAVTPELLRLLMEN